jgi:4-hydroxybenzoate polyprenyltransferase
LVGDTYPVFKSFKALLVAAHFQPTIFVTAVSFLLARELWWEGPAYIIAVGVFFGQLVVGFTNDLNDFADDSRHHRVEKPLVAGSLTETKLRKAIWVSLAFAIVLNLFGPLGIKGGLIYLFGIGCGVTYNFYLKSTPLSPLPYFLAFAALPASIVVATDRTPPLWLLGAGALLGVAAHFANVIKDLKEDVESGIRGLPQIIGEKNSRAVTAFILILTTIILTQVIENILTLTIGLLGSLFLLFGGKRFVFPAIMLVSLLNVLLLIAAVSVQIGTTTN